MEYLERDISKWEAGKHCDVTPHHARWVMRCEKWSSETRVNPVDSSNNGSAITYCYLADYGWTAQRDDRAIPI